MLSRLLQPLAEGFPSFPDHFTAVTWCIPKHFCKQDMNVSLQYGAGRPRRDRKFRRTGLADDVRTCLFEVGILLELS